MRNFIIAVIACCIVGPSLARADWEEPKDGIYTEAEFVNYCAALKDWRVANASAAKSLQGTNGYAALAVMAQTDEKFQASLAAHHLAGGEFSWVGSKAMEAMAVDKISAAQQKMKDDVANQIKKNADDQQAAQDKIDKYTQAIKDGKAVKSADELAQIAKDAKDKQQQSLDEAKQHTDDATSAATEAAQYDQTALAADALAANPPANMTPDEQAAYVDARKADAQTARDAATEARTRQAAALKAAQDATTAASDAGKRATQPDAPMTDDEKAQVKSDNEAGLASAKQELDGLKQAGDLLKQESSGTADVLTQVNNNVPARNMAIYRKHAKEFLDAMGFEEK